MVVCQFPILASFLVRIEPFHIPDRRAGPSGDVDAVLMQISMGINAIWNAQIYSNGLHFFLQPYRLLLELSPEPKHYSKTISSEGLSELQSETVLNFALILAQKPL